MKLIDAKDFSGGATNEVIEGKRIRARLSKRWIKSMTPGEQTLSRFLIKSLVRTSPTSATGLFIEVNNGRIQWHGGDGVLRATDIRTIEASIGEIICTAVYNKDYTLDHLRGQVKNMENAANPNFGQFVHEVKQTAQEDSENKEQKQERLNEVQQMVAEQKDELEKLFSEQPDMQLPSELQKKLMELANEAVEPQFGSPPPSSGAHEPMSDIERLLKKFREIIEYLDKGDGPRDVVSNASYKNAGRMLKAGIPVEAILHAYGLTWPDSVRAELEITDFDVQEYGTPKEGQHRAVPYVEALVEAGVPCMLVGPTQAGKGFLSKNIAENRGLQYGSVPLSAGTSISWLFGRNMPKGFVGTDLIRCYENGGVFLLDEMDAADSNLLIGINDALSNGELSNPVIDQRIPKHEQFIPLAAANTWGLGADADYTGRERLDMATLERWRMGRVAVEYDRGLQEKILRNEAAQPEAKE